MADFDYSGMAAIAKTLLEQFGRTMVFTQITEGTPDDANKPWKPTSTSDTATAKAVLSNITIGEQNTQVFQGVQKRRRIVIVAAQSLPWKPNVRGTVEVQDLVWAISEVEEVNPGETDILYKLTVNA